MWRQRELSVDERARDEFEGALSQLQRQRELRFDELQRGAVQMQRQWLHVQLHGPRPGVYALEAPHPLAGAGGGGSKRDITVGVT